MIEVERMIRRRVGTMGWIMIGVSGWFVVKGYRKLAVSGCGSEWIYVSKRCCGKGS